ncbi:hypothetical protein [Pseudoduganella buxea]|uniref:Uncharacterized protein n=1 Tax=Pseudoduganella buxea TaxID=1949069 RepID=A0A6I3T4N5_9BURK|nr:hypothetical protein [Pseudoduganella buxea]MTV56423.1 hypothetical protein [Pseudoduganella buxea]GGC25592.1 hypothetical protein GCM10011572_53720 [Pseudoduganella buxea]
MRRLAPGHAFTLTQHERYGPDSDAFVALWVEHEARNNFQAQIKTAAGGGLVENGTYRNRFGCVRDAVAIVPRAAAAAHPVTALGPQTAIVVGLADAVAHTGRDHQVRIQFASQRGEGANAGGMAHNTDETGNAPGRRALGHLRTLAVDYGHAFHYIVKNSLISKALSFGPGNALLPHRGGF